MFRYVALLRGVNVGGNNKIPMSGLKAAFENRGFADVLTYINSGNVIFTSSSDNPVDVKAHCETLLEDAFALAVSVAVLRAEVLIDSLKHAPRWWGVGGDSKHNAIFVIAPAETAGIMAQVGDAKPEYEKTDYYGNVIFWSAPLKTFSRTRWSKIVGTPAYAAVTIRNANTVKKIAELAGGR